MIKIFSYNINGIRAAIKKDLVKWITKSNPDIVCFQEIKANEDQFDTEIFTKLGYHNYWFSAQKKGYSGVGIISKIKPENVQIGTGIDFMDFEGRNLRLDFKKFSVMSLYLPSGTNINRLEFKFKYMYEFEKYVNSLKSEIPNLIIGGDYNICHKAIDIHDSSPRMEKVSGFLPEERAWPPTAAAATSGDWWTHRIWLSDSTAARAAAAQEGPEPRTRPESLPHAATSPVALQQECSG